MAFQHMLFLRSDVYEQFVEETADRAKQNLIPTNWSDPEQLTHLIHQRVISTIDAESREEAWRITNPTLDDGRTAVAHMIESSLMRPRFLIELCERAISFAVNRGHAAVMPDDVQAALEKHSIYLVSFFGYELRDVSGISDKIFYAFMGHPDRLDEKEIDAIVTQTRNGYSTNELIEMLIWYGFLGIPDGHGKPVYIYHRDYDMRRLQAERDRLGSGVKYSVNPAFLRGLEN
jgi:hypothetical protein